MVLFRRAFLATAGAASALPRRGRAQADRVIRIGVLTDMSGTYRDNTGPNAVACARQAVAEFTAANPGIAVETIIGDHQNKADLGASLAREWFDRGGVDAIADVSNSAVAFACGTVVVDKDKVQINTGAGSSDITGRACNANTTHWTYDTWCMAHSTGAGVVHAGGNRWFFITADYAFGKAIQADTTRFVEQAGGRVLGSAAFPFPGTTDFSSQLLQAQASGANVVALAASGSDLINCVKQAGEFGITKGGVKLAAMAGFVQDAHALGLTVAQGLILTEIFYWDLNGRTRAFLNRVKPNLVPNNYPNQNQASAYAGTLHYLKAVKELGVARAKASGREVVDMMKRLPTDDDCFGPGSVRADGRALRPAYLFQIKSPAESHDPWDCYKLLSTTPAAEAFRPLQDGKCPLVKV